MTDREFNIMRLEQRIANLSARGQHNMRIVGKLRRQLRKLQNEQ